MTPDRPAGEVEELERRLFELQDPPGYAAVYSADQKVLAIARDAIAALRRLREENEGRWRPIESAPRDNTRVLVCWMHRAPSGSLLMGGEMTTAFWNRGEWLDAIRRTVMNTPTHWMELPKPPTGQDGTP